MQLAQLQGRKQDAQRLQEELDKLQTAQNLLSQLPPVVKLEDGSVKEEDGSPSRKRAKRAIDPQRREALKNRLKGRAREIGTKHWLLAFARKFAAFNEIPAGDWEPTLSNLVPPKELLTNEALENLFAEVFEESNVKGAKPAVQSAKKWANHALTFHGRPAINYKHAHLYRSVLDMLAGMTKESDWVNYRVSVVCRYP